MPIRNQNWYNLQSTRRYPLDDKSTGVDDNGEFIRDDIIVDCHVRFPESFGQYAYVQGINITDNLVTIVIGASSNLNGENSRTIAVVTAPKPVATSVNVELTPVRYGVSGWIVFGPGIDNNFVGRYTTPKQTFIGLRNARPYRPLPIPTLGKLGRAAGLEGVIRLTATSPLTATYYENYTVPQYDPETGSTYEYPIQAIVISGEAPTTLFNPYKEFLGPCTERPESGTCPKVPVERVGGVSPDCANGNINIVVEDDLTIEMFQECGGMDITTERGLANACGPDTRKKDPNDKCPKNETPENECWPVLPDIPEDSVVCPPEPEYEIPLLPLCISFDPCVDDTLETISGGFGPKKTVAPPVCCPEPVEEPSIQTNHYIKGASNKRVLNIALLRAAHSDWAYDKTVAAELSIKPAVNARNNGGIILNYIRVPENKKCVVKYVAVILDQDAGELQIKRFDGKRLIKESFIPVTTTPETWYLVSGRAVWIVDDTATITASLHDAQTKTLIATLTTTIQNYELVNGRPGIVADAAITYFNRFLVSEI